MVNLNIILFCIGFVISVVALIIMLVKSMKSNKMGFMIPFVLIIGLASLGSGVWITIKPINSINSTVVNNPNISTTKSKPTVSTINKSTAKVSTSVAKENKNAPFDAKGSVVPIISYSELGNYKCTLDADGSKELNDGHYTPEGIRFTNGGKVAISDGKTYEDGKHYTQYWYSIDNVSGAINVLESNLATKDEFRYDMHDLGGGKSEDYPVDSGYEMKYIDFIYKYIPVSKPKTTIKNNFLSGSYFGKQEKILETTTTIAIKIIDDKLVDFKCRYIAGMDSIYGYKIELLGKNAYKLYLYPTTTKADTNGGGTTIFDEPLKRTFIIYMKSKDSFDIVFIADDVGRASVNMKRE
ncbi:hypothetical protein [Clostridium sp.]